MSGFSGNIRAFLMGLIAAMLLASPAMASPGGGRGGADPSADRARLPFAPGEIIAKFRSSLTSAALSDTAKLPAALRQLNTKYKLKRIDRVFADSGYRGPTPMSAANSAAAARMEDELQRVCKLVFDSDADVEQIVAQYARDPGVEYAQPNYVYTLDWRPNDYYYNTDLRVPPIYSWGQSYADMWGMRQIHCEAPWDLAQGQGVVVAVIDTGIDRSHADIATNVWQNPREIPGNGVDDDYDGRIDDVYGWDFSDSDGTTIDTDGHGTHCAGTIAAVANNAVGVIGVAPQCSVMPVKVFPKSTSSVCSSGIIYAAARGARVLSNSWGSDGVTSDPTLQSAIDYARSLGCIVVFAAGNSNSDVAYHSPANYPATVAVAATDYLDRRASYSNYGPGIDISAPGNDILSLRAANTDMYGDGTHVVGQYYYRANGTSMACPLVAGAAALLWSLQPGWTSDQVESALLATADDIAVPNPGLESSMGAGRLNLERACTEAYGPSVVAVRTDVDDPTGDKDKLADPGETVSLRVTLRNVGAAAAGVLAVLSTDDGYAAVTQGDYYLGDIAHRGEVTATFTLAISASAPPPHHVVLQLRITGTPGYSVTRTVGLDIPRRNRAGWPKDVTPDCITPVDLNGDGQQEVVVTSWASTIMVYNNDGTPFSPAWPRECGATYNGVASGDLGFGDLDGDGQVEMIVPTKDSTCLHALRPDGTNLSGWPVPAPIGASWFDVTQPAIADIDPSSPGLEVACEVITTDQAGVSRISVYLLDSGGRNLPGFPVCLGSGRSPMDTKGDTLAVGDIDNDGSLDIVAMQADYESPGSFIYALDNRGRTKPGWPYAVPNGLEPMAIVLGDLDDNGDLEIVLSTGMPVGRGTDPYQNQIAVLNKFGKRYSSAWSNVRSIRGAHIALGDLDDDGDLEIVVGGYGNPHVYAMHHNAASVTGWPVSNYSSWQNYTTVSGIADVDGDGRMEVVGSARDSVWVWHSDGSPLEPTGALIRSSLGMNQSFECCPSVADLDGNGSLELLAGIAETNGRTCVWDLVSPRMPVEWAMQGHDAQRTGCHVKRDRGLSGLSVQPLYGLGCSGPQGGPFLPAGKTYTLVNMSTTALTWSAAKTQSWVSLSSANGTLQPGQSAQVSVAISPGANTMADGQYSDTVTFTSSVEPGRQIRRRADLDVASASLLVSPTSAASFVRKAGEPIRPRSQTYTLRNTGFAKLSWSISKSADWLTLSSAEGVLEPLASITVTASMSTSAYSLSAGSYSGTLTFRNLTNGRGDTTRTASLAVDPGTLSVGPPVPLLSHGAVGGPFAPGLQRYKLTNDGYGPLAWTAASTVAWARLSATAGTLTPGGSTLVDVMVDPSAEALAAGLYKGAVNFTNSTNGRGSATQPASLYVGAPIYVNPSGMSLVCDGRSWTTAFRTIADALIGAQPGQELRVGPGTYSGDLTLKNGVVLSGGYSGIGNKRDPEAFESRIAAVTGADSAIVDGFTIVGKVTCNYSQRNMAAISNNRLTGSISLSYDCSPLISGNVINCSSGTWSSAIYASYRCSPVVIGNRIITSQGGIRVSYDCNPIVADNIMKGSGNQSVGLAWYYDCAGQAVNNTILGFDTGMAMYYEPTPRICNNIFAYNNANGLLYQYLDDPLPVMLNNNVFGSAANYSAFIPGLNDTDISADPRFVDLAHADYRLMPDSPCINAGYAPISGSPLEDIDGQPRVQCGRIDIGACEFRPWRVSADPDATPVILRGITVTVAFPDAFYISSDDRAWGMRVEKPGHGLADGVRADILGVLATNADGERVIVADCATSVGSGSALPFYLGGRSLGGGDWLPKPGGGQAGIDGASGANNIGLLVRLSGTVTQIDPEGRYFYVDDGSNLADGTQTGAERNIGVRVAQDGRGYTRGRTVMVTGASSCFADTAGKIRRLLRAKTVSFL